MTQAIQALKRVFSRKTARAMTPPVESNGLPVHHAASRADIHPEKKRGKVSSTETRPQGSLPISIHPDPTYYVETKTSPYARVQRVIDMSDGGVIGITGERGAGKSVLLNTLINSYSKDFLTV